LSRRGQLVLLASARNGRRCGRKGSRSNTSLFHKIYFYTLVVIMPKAGDDSAAWLLPHGTWRPGD